MAAYAIRRLFGVGSCCLFRLYLRLIELMTANTIEIMINFKSRLHRMTTPSGSREL